MYCGRLICGVEVVKDYPDVVVLYAHKACHEEGRYGPRCSLANDS